MDQVMRDADKYAMQINVFLLPLMGF